MRQTSVSKPSVAFVGAGALAAGLGQTIRQHGYVIEELIVRRVTAEAKRLAKKLNARLTTLEAASLQTQIVWLAVTDDAIAPCAESLAAAKHDWSGKIVLHSSGALSSAALAPLRKCGAAVASLHPMMTFVRSSKRPLRDALRGVSFAVEGDARAVRVATRVAKDLGGEVLKLSPSRKAAYHAFGSFLSPLIVAELTAAEEVATLAGIRKAQAQRIMRPIVQRTIANYLDNGGQEAFSGPLVRGDVETVRRHVNALHGQSLDVYRALAQLAVRKLKVRNRKQLLEILAQED